MLLFEYLKVQYLLNWKNLLVDYMKILYQLGQLLSICFCIQFYKWIMYTVVNAETFIYTFIIIYGHISLSFWQNFYEYVKALEWILEDFRHCGNTSVCVNILMRMWKYVQYWCEYTWVLQVRLGYSDFRPICDFHSYPDVLLLLERIH